MTTATKSVYRMAVPAYVYASIEALDEDDAIGCAKQFCANNIDGMDIDITMPWDQDNDPAGRLYFLEPGDKRYEEPTIEDSWDATNHLLAACKTALDRFQALEDAEEATEADIAARCAVQDAIRRAETGAP